MLAARKNHDGAAIIAKKKRSEDSSYLNWFASAPDALNDGSVDHSN